MSNPYRNEVLLIKDSFVYLYDRSKGKKICRVKNILRGYYDTDFVLSDNENGGFAIIQDKIKVYDKNCKLLKIFNNINPKTVLTFTKNDKYIITGGDGGIIYVRKISN